MKYCSFQIVLLILTISCQLFNAEKLTIAQARNMMKTPKDMCMKRIGVTAEVVNRVWKGQFPQEEKYKCFLKCVMMTLGTMRNDVPTRDLMLRKIDILIKEDDAEILKSMANVCFDKLPADIVGCESSWTFIKCIWDTDRNCTTECAMLFRIQKTIIAPTYYMIPDGE